MDFLEKLNFLMERYGLNKSSLSQKSEIPYTTIDGWYKKGYEGLKLTTLRKIASYFNTSLDYWILDDITDPNYGKASGFQVEYNEMNHIKKYRFVSENDNNGKILIDSTMEYIYDRIKSSQDQIARIAELEASQEQSATIIDYHALQNTRHLYTYLQKIACAGTGFYFEDIPTMVIEAPFMRGADFVIGVNGDSMEPTYHDGDKLYVQKVESLSLGDEGIFTVRGECFVKELGECGLVSRNPEYDDIPGTEDVRLIGRVLGKVEEN